MYKFFSQVGVGVLLYVYCRVFSEAYLFRDEYLVYRARINGMYISYINCALLIECLVICAFHLVVYGLNYVNDQ
jgi:hypothetical protein